MQMQHVLVDLIRMDHGVDVVLLVEEVFSIVLRVVTTIVVIVLKQLVNLATLNLVVVQYLLLTRQ